MVNLTSQKCVACQADAPKVTDEELVEFIKEIPDWEPTTEDSILKLRRVFNFDDYAQAVQFSNQVADLAEEEDHHPAILLEWGKVQVTWWTHKILGLHKNDFIAAAKTDRLLS
jgi:4a-hydroxytetrahydrobiopterin dehydratase